ncbi:MAG: hypothetical protein SWK76_16520 [Actinomycetota bacterium]|nr:hypothetical protein [Actinomycetota bacterium]
MGLDNLTAVAGEYELSVPAEGELRQALGEAMSHMLKGLRERGCTMMGHIKGILSDASSPPLFLSITIMENNLRFKGGPIGGEDRLPLALNVIVADVDEEVIDDMLGLSLSRKFTVIRN